MRFIGLDLTDPYAAKPRAVDVAVLDEHLGCELSRAPWTPSSAGSPWMLDLGAHTSGPTSGDVLVVDGPLALATMGHGTRECERLLGAPGHTGDVLPAPRSRPFAGYIRGSVEVAQTLSAAGWRIATTADVDCATMFEAFPGAAWKVLGAALPHKATPAGNAARRALLVTAGVALPTGALSHDALDAAMCALIGYWTRAAPQRTRPVGLPCSDVDGVLREGFIMQPTRERTSGPHKAR